MRGQKIFWGIFLILLGVVFVLRNIGLIGFEFRWSEIFRLWPLILIFWGINALIGNSKYQKAAWITPVLLVVLILIFTKFNFHFNNSSDYRSSDHWNEDKNINVQSFTEPWNENINNAEFNFTGGAAEFIMQEQTSELLNAYVNTKAGEYSLERIADDSTTVLNLKMIDEKVTWKNGKWENEVNIKLNTSPVWNMNFELGAGTGDFDLSSYKISKLDIETGAASLDIKVKDNLPKTMVDIEAGASAVTVRVPAKANCILDIEAVLSSKDIKGFVKKDDDRYFSENFSSTGNVIEIKVEAGVSKIDIVRY